MGEGGGNSGGGKSGKDRGEGDKGNEAAGGCKAGKKARLHWRRPFQGSADTVATVSDTTNIPQNSIATDT